MIPTLVILWIIALYWISVYNRIVWLSNTVKNAFADVDVQTKKRRDLVDNLVNTVKWYASHEKSTFEEVTKARTAWANATTQSEKDEANNMLSSTLKSLFAISESYPELKANTNFLDLQTQLKSLEDEIAASRRYYNATINEYNTLIMSFPANILANMFGFTAKDSYFTSDEAEKQAPKVDFSK